MLKAKKKPKPKPKPKRKRKHPRAASENLVGYACLTEDAMELKQGIGKTLNISKGGMLLETSSMKQ